MVIVLVMRGGKGGKVQVEVPRLEMVYGAVPPLILKVTLPLHMPGQVGFVWLIMLTCAERPPINTIKQSVVKSFFIKKSFNQIYNLS